MVRFVLNAIGIMCGTSKDGIDVVIIETNGNDHVKITAHKSIIYSHIFSIALRAAEYALQETKGDIELAKINFNKYLHQYINKVFKNNSAEEIIDSLKKDLNTNVISIDNIIKHYTLLCNDLIKDLLKENNNQKIDVIGDHGITLYHDPKNSITIQVADSQLLADLQHTPVISNFRINDVKNGGQGAPLAPIYHQALLDRSSYENWVVVNLGGTANITLKDSNGELIGFDTGPANFFLDCYIRSYTRGKSQMDQDGKNSLSGRIILEFLENLKNEAINYLGENYIEKLPPKSLCISNYNDINGLIKEEYNFNDVCATLSAFTAYCVIKGIELVNAPVKIIIACGGGAKNQAIISYLKSFAQDLLKFSINIISADETKLSSKYMEAELFGYLAVKTLHNDPITFPSTTGCTKPTVGGKCYIPDSNDISDNVIELLKINPHILDECNVEILGNI